DMFAFDFDFAVEEKSAGVAIDGEKSRNAKLMDDGADGVAAGGEKGGDVDRVVALIFGEGTGGALVDSLAVYIQRVARVCGDADFRFLRSGRELDDFSE